MMFKIIRKHHRLIKRRGIKNHVKLTYRFWKIGQDPYVKATRKRIAAEKGVKVRDV